MEIKKRGRPAGSKNKKSVNWEALSKKLETALKDEIAANEENLKKLNRFVGIEHHVDHLEAEIDKHKLMVLEQRGVIGYLETKIKKLED